MDNKITGLERVKCLTLYKYNFLTEEEWKLNRNSSANQTTPTPVVANKNESSTNQTTLVVAGKTANRMKALQEAEKKGDLYEDNYKGI